VYSYHDFWLLSLREEHGGANCTAILAELVQGMHQLVLELHARPRLREMMGDPSKEVAAQAVELAFSTLREEDCPGALHALRWEIRFGRLRYSGQLSALKESAAYSEQEWIYAQFVRNLYDRLDGGQDLWTHPWPQESQSSQG
jgi:hypothetical protein